MKLFNKILSQAEINELRNWFNQSLNKKYDLFKSQSELLNSRIDLSNKDECFAIVDRLVKNNFPIPYEEPYGGYQLQYKPLNLHMDEPNGNEHLYRYTMVIALDDLPQSKTIVFKEKFEKTSLYFNWLASNDLYKLIKTKQRKNNISELENISHTYDERIRDYVANYLTLDGIFEYSAGSAVIFNSNQIHCTNNWVELIGRDVKEVLQIHTCYETPLDFDID